MNGDDMPPDPAIRDRVVELPTGVRLHYVEAGDALAPTLVLLHGYTDSWWSFRLVLPLLARAHRVLAPDARGHGRSSAPAEGYAVGDIARDVSALLEILDLRSASLIGHSMGSFVARRVALGSPDRVRCLVLVGAAPVADNPVTRGLAEEVNRLGDAIPADFVEAFQAGCVYRRELVPDWFFAGCVEASRGVEPRVWRAALAGQLAERPEDTAHPTLILGGRHDSVFGPAEQEALAATRPGSRLVLYRHCGHTPHWEQPGRFVEDVEEYLAVVPGGGRP